jgi:hypothetical protein
METSRVVEVSQRGVAQRRIRVTPQSSVAIDKTAMPSDAFDSAKSLATFARLTGIASGTLVAPPLSFHDVRRLITVTEDDEVEPNEESDDPLSELLVEAAANLATSHRVGSSVVDVDPEGSLSTLFDGESDLARSLKPKLFLAYDLTDGASICGFCSTCQWTVDDALSTKKLTAAYCREHDVPRFTSSDTWIIDVVASSKPKTGAQLVLAVYLMAMRSKTIRYLTAVAVSPEGKSLFAKMGFRTHSFREGTARTLCWIKAGDMRAEDLHQRLDWDEAIESVCWRRALTPRAKHSLLSRC